MSELSVWVICRAKPKRRHAAALQNAPREKSNGFPIRINNEVSQRKEAEVCTGKADATFAFPSSDRHRPVGDGNRRGQLDAFGCPRVERGTACGYSSRYPRSRSTGVRAQFVPHCGNDGRGFSGGTRQARCRCHSGLGRERCLRPPRLSRRIHREHQPQPVRPLPVQGLFRGGFGPAQFALRFETAGDIAKVVHQRVQPGIVGGVEHSPFEVNVVTLFVAETKPPPAIPSLSLDYREPKPRSRAGLLNVSHLRYREAGNPRHSSKQFSLRAALLNKARRGSGK